MDGDAVQASRQRDGTDMTDLVISAHAADFFWRCPGAIACPEAQHLWQDRTSNAASRANPFREP